MRSRRRPRAEPLPITAGQGRYVVDLALEAKLLRLRLLTINAVVTVAEPDPTAARQAVSRSNGASRPTGPHRRADAEILLGDAQRTLAATTRR